MKITIKNIDITLKYGFRAQMVYERIQGETFQPISLNNILLMFYSVIISSNKDIQLTFDEFIEYIDNTPKVVVEFTNWMAKELDIDKYINQNDKPTKGNNKTPKKA